MIEVHLHFPERIHVDVTLHIPALAEVAALIIKGFNDLKQEIRTMGETTDQAIGELTTGVASLKSTIEKFKGDVTAALGLVTDGGTLTAAQQAGVGAIKQSIADMIANVSAADTALPQSGQVAPLAG